MHIASHTVYKFIHRLCRDMLTHRVEVGCVGVVQFLWHTCVISGHAQPPLILDFVKPYPINYYCCLIDYYCVVQQGGRMF